MGLYWYPLVYSRTRDVDYRYLALPNDDQLEQAWLDTHIDVLLGMPDLLDETPRWAAFQNATHCVFGVACMMRDLGAEKEITLDRKKRRLYLFAAYVAEITGSRGWILPAPTDLQLFYPLLQFVRDHWEVSDLQERYFPTRTEAKSQQFPLPPRLSDDDFDLHKKWISTNDEAYCIWPDRERELLWSMACEMNTPISVALGLWSRHEAQEGPFRNVTLTSVHERERVRRRLLEVEALTDERRSELLSLVDEAYLLGDDPLPRDRQQWLETVALQQYYIKPDLVRQVQERWLQDSRNRRELELRWNYRQAYANALLAQRRAPTKFGKGLVKSALQFKENVVHRELDENVRRRIRQFVDSNYQK